MSWLVVFLKFGHVENIQKNVSEVPKDVDDSFVRASVDFSCIIFNNPNNLLCIAPLSYYDFRSYDSVFFKQLNEPG